MKYFSLYLILFLTLLLVGCLDNKNEELKENPDVIGEVISTRDSELLLDIHTGTITDYGYEDEVLVVYDNSLDMENIQNGEKLEVWFDGELTDSNPPKGKVKQYKVID
ncbi:DUF3221 domain-containing protein [Gracilibacillus suaedae]|uniref:DUF3221 domain-containing protein n=1 Tax=Gracilibacillus suaedae TaxID=2820273 RepID=UPI001ABDF06C|nr:DUF3221 domain-containing protein [Gracilibacillus suaedae]